MNLRSSLTEAAKAKTHLTADSQSSRHLEVLRSTLPTYSTYTPADIKRMDLLEPWFSCLHLLKGSGASSVLDTTMMYDADTERLNPIGVLSRELHRASTRSDITSLSQSGISRLVLCRSHRCTCNAPYVDVAGDKYASST